MKLINSDNINVNIIKLFDLLIIMPKILFVKLYKFLDQSIKFIFIFLAFLIILDISGIAFNISKHVYAQAINRKETSVGVKRKQRTKKLDDQVSKISGPRISKAALLASSVEGRLTKGINNTLQQMRKIIKSLPARSEDKLRIMKRMLQLQLDQAAIITSKEYELYQDQWNSWNARGKKGAEPKLVHKKSNRMWIKFSQLSSAIIKEFPKHKSLDSVMYNQALGLDFLGKKDESARALSMLIQKYPNSSSAGDAYHSLGDYFFDKSDFQNASKNYIIVTRKYKNSKRYPWSVFKLGWSYFNQEKFHQALSQWKKTVILSRKKDVYSQTLRKEALRDMVYAFAEIGDVKAAISYYRANGGQEYITKFLSLLANILVDQGKFEKAVNAYKRLQSLTPSSPEAAEAQKSLIVLVYELGNYNRLWSELRLYARLYGKNSSWARAQKNKRLIIETEADIRNEILYYAKITHQSGQKTKSDALKKQAEKGYVLYLSQFPKSVQSIEAKFNLADLHYFRNNFAKAGRLYLEISILGKDAAVTVDDKNKKTNIHRDSAKNMLDSFYKAYEPELKKVMAQKKPVDVSKSKMPLSISASNFIKACGTYLKFYPDDAKIRKNCNVYIAETYYRLNDKKLALKHLWVVARQYPKSKEGKKAVNSILPLYKYDKKGLNLALIELRKIPEYNKGELGKKLSDLQRGVHEEFVSTEKKSIQKAKGFLKLASTYPDYKNVYKYYYNASLAFSKGGDLISALEADKVIITKFPKVPEAEISLLRMAEMSANLVDYSDSLKYYMLYAKRYPKSKKFMDSLQKACDLSIALHDDPGRILTNCAPLKTRNPAAYVSVMEDIIYALYARTEYQKLKSYVAQYVKTPGVDNARKLKAFYKLYALSSSGSRGSDKKVYAANIIRLHKSNSAMIAKDLQALDHVAEIYFYNTLPSSYKFNKLQLKGGKLQTMVNSVKVMENSLAKLDAGYKNIIQLGNAKWAVASYYEVARAYEAYSKELADPPGIDGAKLEDVKKQLAPQAKKSAATAELKYKEAQKLIDKHGVYSDYSLKVTNAIIRLKGGKTTTDDWVLIPDFLGSPVSSSLAIKLR